MPNANFLREQSKKCWRLAAACTDQMMTDQLSEMAAEYRAEANAMDNKQQGQAGEDWEAHRQDAPQMYRARLVSLETKELYSSANGDVWYLARDSETGRVFVRHQANVNSGGQVTDTDVDAFLRRGGEPPEKQVLLRLAGTYFQN